ncbi:hypothetical protein AAC387_Pa08g1009 [Persea americana]
MEEKKPHVVCIPFPLQGHINPMLQLAKLLHSRGFFITFVHTDYTHKRLSTLDSFDGFRFEVISDGFSPSTVGEVQEYRNAEHLCQSLKENCVASFRDLLMKLHHPSDGHRVTCVVSDPIMTFILKVSEEMGIPEEPNLFSALGDASTGDDNPSSALETSTCDKEHETGSFVFLKSDEHRRELMPNMIEGNLGQIRSILI